MHSTGLGTGQRAEGSEKREASGSPKPWAVAPCSSGNWAAPGAARVALIRVNSPSIL